MSEQSEFDWTRAEQLGMLERAVLLGQPRVSSVALKSVLKAIDGYGRGREAWPGYESLSTSAGVSLATAKRAVKALVGLGLLCVERRGPRTLNHYRIVWSELSLLTRERSVTRTERSVTRTERSVMVTLPKCHGDTLNDKKRTKETTTTAESVVVVSSCGVARAEEAVAKAVSCGLSNGDIQNRVAAWKALPMEQQKPGILYNWMTKPGSFVQCAKVAELPQLRLAKLPSNGLEIRRADLIRHGRARGWTHQQLQAAVERFERELELCKERN